MRAVCASRVCCMRMWCASSRPSIVLKNWVAEGGFSLCPRLRHKIVVQQHGVAKGPTCLLGEAE